MISLYSPSVLHAARIHSALRPYAAVVTYRDWVPFARSAVGSFCTVAAIEDLGAAGEVHRLSRLCDAHEALPLVVVTRQEADGARMLRTVRLDELVWFSEIESQLWRAIRQAASGNYLWQVAREIERAPHLCSPLRVALAAACRRELPLLCVGKLGDSVGRDRRTLWRQWRATVPEPGPRLEDFLHWLVLIHAVARKTPGTPWSDVAAQIGVDPRTLARLATQLFGAPLRELPTEREHVMSAWSQQLLGPLLDPPRHPGTP